MHTHRQFRSTSTFHYDGNRLDVNFALQSAWQNDERRAILPRDFRSLTLLIQNIGKFVSIREVHPTSIGTAQHSISRLRIALPKIRGAFKTKRRRQKIKEVGGYGFFPDGVAYPPVEESSKQDPEERLMHEITKSVEVFYHQGICYEVDLGRGHLLVDGEKRRLGRVARKYLFHLAASKGTEVPLEFLRGLSPSENLSEYSTVPAVMMSAIRKAAPDLKPAIKKFERGYGIFPDGERQRPEVAVAAE